jgi:hypothetical protein
MAGPPRRIAGNLHYDRTAWQVALHGWDQTGWGHQLNNLPAYYHLRLAIVRIGRPFHQDELLPFLGPWGDKLSRYGPHTWGSPVDRYLQGPPHPLDSGMQFKLQKVAYLAAAAGLECLATFGDMMDLLERLGLLVRCHPHSGGLLTLNPAPRPVWEVLDFEDPRSRWGAELQALRSDYRVMEDEIRQFVRWAAGGVLRTTPRRMAVRLSRPMPDVLGGLRLLDHISKGAFLAAYNELEPDTEVALAASALTVRA